MAVFLSLLLGVCLNLRNLSASLSRAPLQRPCVSSCVSAAYLLCLLPRTPFPYAGRVHLYSTRTLEAAEVTAILRVPKEAVRVTRDAELQGGVGVGVVEQVEGGLDVVLPDEPVGSLRAGNEVGVDADVVGTLRDHGGGGAAR